MTINANSDSDSQTLLRASWDYATQSFKTLATVTQGPLQYTRNATTTTVAYDTVTAANNRPLPVVITAGDSLGPLDTNTGNASGNTLRVALASNGFISTLFIRNGSSQTATLDTTTSTNNRPFPIVQLAGDSLAPVAMGTGASGTTTPRVILSSDSTITLPTGASTSALQTTGNTSLASIDTKTPAVGQAVMASSSPVVIASNQSAISVAPAGKAKSFVKYFTFAGVTSAAYTSLAVGTITLAVNELIIFDTGGQPFILGVDTGGGTSYVDTLYLPANVTTVIDLAIPAGSTLGVKSLGSTISSGNLGVTGLG